MLYMYYICIYIHLCIICNIICISIVNKYFDFHSVKRYLSESSLSFVDFMGHHLVILFCKKHIVKILNMRSLLMPSKAPTWGGPTCH